MIHRIKNHKILNQHLKELCRENNAFVTIADEVRSNGFLILYPDTYFQSKKLKKTPKSIDCFIVMKCGVDSHKFVMVELKDINDTENLRNSHIREKFENTIKEFSSKTFRKVFQDQIIPKNSRLLLVTNIAKRKKSNSLGKDLSLSHRVKVNKMIFRIFHTFSGEKIKCF